MSSGYIDLPLEGSGGGGVTSINGDASAAQLIVGGTNIAVVNTGPTHTINLNGPVPISLGGTGQSNQQAALNNLTNITGATNGDVLQYLTGNAQFAPFTAAPPTGDPNTFAYFDPSGDLDSIPNWTLYATPIQSAMNADLTYNPNNLSANPTAHNFSLNITPLQASPNDSANILALSSNLDATSNGFNFGSAGKALNLINGFYNYGGNGSTYGTLAYASFSSSIGNGTDPVTIKGIDFFEGFFTLNANATIDGSMQGFNFQPAIDAAAITTSNFSVSAFEDFANIPNTVYGYTSFAAGPNIGTIANNHNYTGQSLSPTITTLAGNAGVLMMSCFPTITTLGTGGFQGLTIQPNITTQAAASGWSGVYVGGALTTMGAGSNWQGFNANPTITTSHGTVTCFEANPTITAGDANVQLYQGNMSNVNGSANPSVLNLSGLTADGLQSSFSADNVHMNINGVLNALSAQGVQGQNVIFTEYHTPAGATITGTDIIMNILSPNVDFGSLTSSVALGPNGLGVNMVGFAGQMGGHGSMDLMSAVLPTAIFGDDFTLGEWRNVNAYVINAGYTGACTKATAFYHEIAGAGPFATTHWGLRVVTDMDNYVTKMAINTANQKAASPFVLDIVGQTQNRQTATDAGVYGHYVNLTSHTTADASNELFAFFSENEITVDATFTNSKALVGSSQTLTRGDGADDGALDGLVGHESFLRISSGAAGVTTDSFGFLSLVQAQSGTATNVYHFRSVSIESGGTITNQYGIYLPHDSTVPLKNWLSGGTQFGGASFVAPNTNTALVVSDGHIGSIQTTAPTVTADASAGTGATASMLNATDTAGKVSITTGTIGISTGSYATVTFDKAYAVAPIVILTPASSTLSTSVYVTSTTTTFSVNFAVAGGITSTYILNYQVIETQ